MIKDNIIENQSVKPNSFELQALKNNFPQFFNKDGEFLFEQFKALLQQNDVTLNKEGYELKFLGKSYARYLSSTKTETFISPNIDHNSLPENQNSENVYIIGDNIDALKHLMGSYTGKIKCIYMDPPYNTDSKDFAYADSFSFDADKLSEILGIDIEEAERVINLKGTSSHSAWLTFIYPRLVLARTLLTDDGVIFISINDNEMTNLKLICDEIFGEGNCLAEFIVRSNPRGSQASKFVAVEHEYLLAYVKDKNANLKLGFSKSEQDSEYNLSDELGKYRLLGLRQRGGAWRRTDRPDMYYPIFVNPNTGRVSLEESAEFNKCALPVRPSGEDSRWTWGKAKALKDSDLLVGKRVNRDGQEDFWDIFRKDYLYQNGEISIKKAKSIFDEKELNYQNGGNELKTLLGDSEIFKFPKPSYLIKKILEMVGLSDNDIVLDFFSGSATSAHAVLSLNATDSGKRKYILVQIAESLKENTIAYKKGYRSIDEIGRYRIQQAAKQIKETTNAKIDYGFKLYHLEPILDETLDKLESFNPDSLIYDDMVDIFSTATSKGKESILTTYLVMDGCGFTDGSKPYKLNKYIADKFEDNLYFIEQGLTSEDIVDLVKRLESRELDINRVILYSYSITFSVLQELKKNLSNLQNNKHVEIIERY